MKKIFAVALLISILFSTVAVAEPIKPFFSHCFPLFGTVKEVVAEENYIVIVDFTGNEWEYGEIKNWKVNDTVIVIMYDNMTPIIYDDIIIAVYSRSWI